MYIYDEQNLIEELRESLPYIATHNEMSNKEAIYKILDHARIHREKEPRAVFITEALLKAVDALIVQDSIAACAPVNHDDLISRSELKEAIRNYSAPASEKSDDFSKGETECACEIIDMIDNAKPIDVSIYIWNKSNELLKKRMTYLGRPNLKWIIADPALSYYHECPHCHWKNEYTASLENFCPNCGADMRRDNNG